MLDKYNNHTLIYIKLLKMPIIYIITENNEKEILNNPKLQMLYPIYKYNNSKITQIKSNIDNKSSTFQEIFFSKNFKS